MPAGRGTVQGPSRVQARLHCIDRHNHQPTASATAVTAQIIKAIDRWWIFKKIPRWAFECSFQATGAFQLKFQLKFQLYFI
jgi:hypothetical protein